MTTQKVGWVTYALNILNEIESSRVSQKLLSWNKGKRRELPEAIGSHIKQILNTSCRTHFALYVETMLCREMCLRRTHTEGMGGTHKASR